MKSQIEILILDDETMVGETLQALLTAHGYECEFHSKVANVLSAVQRLTPQLLITDLKMPELSGIEVLNRVKQLSPHTEVIVVTGYGTLETAVLAIKDGAFDFISKPYEITQVLAVVRRCLQKFRLAAPPAQLWDLRDRNFAELFRSLLSPELQKAVRGLTQSFDEGKAVLVSGEAGTGKAIVARILHEGCASREFPLVRMNCLSVPAEELEAHLFGNGEADAASSLDHKIGQLEIASNGTLIIESVEAMPLPLQNRLVQVLSSGFWSSVGGKPRPLACRLVFTIAKEPDALMQANLLLKDLVRFIGRNTISLLPLRRTPQNLLPYSEFFIKDCCERFRRADILLDLEASKVVMSYPWPGNLFELERVLERAILLCTEDMLSVSLFPETVVENAVQASQLKRGKPLPVKIALDNFILEALRRNSGNRGLVALELGVSERTLYRRLKDIRESSAQ